MGLAADGAVGHRAGGEAPDDLRDRLDLLDRDRLPAGGVGALEPEQAAQRHQPRGLLVDAGGVLLEDVVALAARGVLEPEDRLGVEQVRLAVAAPLVLAAHGQLAVGRADATPGVRRGVALGDLLGDGVELHAAELGRRTGEVAVDHGLREADGLEGLGAGVGRDRGDAHLGHHLEHALAEALDQVADGDLGLDLHVEAVAGEVLDRLHGEVGVDRGRAVPDQERDVVHLAHVAGLEDQTDLGPGLLAHQVVVDGAGEQQRRDRRQLGGAVAVREHDHARSVGDGLGDLVADLVETARHRGAAALDLVEAAADVGDEAGHVAVAVDVPDLRQLRRCRGPGTAPRSGGRRPESARAGSPPGRWCRPAR